jgi:hypothetical protein
MTCDRTIPRESLGRDAFEGFWSEEHYVAKGEAVSLHLKAQLALSALAGLRAGERVAAAKMFTGWCAGNACQG